MLQHRVWRAMLIELAGRHRGCATLDHAVKAMSREGHHAEVAALASVATYFARFFPLSSAPRSSFPRAAARA